MTYTNWDQLCRAADGWEDPYLSSFIAAERRVAENSANSKAMYRNTVLFPGTLQLTGYVNSLCRGRGIDDVANTEIQTLRFSRQALLHASKVRQLFLVDEAVLTYRPGGFHHIVKPQLRYTLDVLQADMDGDNQYDFRIVPQGATLTSRFKTELYDDTFALFSTDDKITGFTDGWVDRVIYPADGKKLDNLTHTWDQVGKLAMDRMASIHHLEHVLHA